MEDDKNKQNNSKNRSADIIDLKAGMKLKQARKLKGMTQKDLAESLKTRVEPELIHQYETSQISVTDWCLSELAEALGVHADYFLPDHQIASDKALYSELNIEMITIMNRLPIYQQQAVWAILSAFNKANRGNRAKD
ncbi:MAG: helix-turn-helix domain-containing protein [Candidatus Halichondribacter symbioticus]